MKKRLPLLLFACALILSSCGSKGESLPPESEEGVLIYAALNPVSKELESSVARFNERHEEVQIEIRDYSYEGGIDRLLTELALGRVPDIMEMHYYGKAGPMVGIAGHYWVVPGSYEDPEDEYWMPYQQMAQKGYLEDLWPYIENDPALGREGVMEGILKTAEVNGSLSMLFGNVILFTLSGRESVVGDRYSWTLEDVKEVLATMPEGSTIMRYNLTKRDIYFNLLRFTMEQFVDRNTCECFFDSQDFQDLVEFLEKLPDEVDEEKAEEAEEEIRWNIKHGRQMLEGAMIVLPQEVGYIDSLWQERAAFPGFPTTGGSSGSFFYPYGNILAMSSICRNKEAAWEYIRLLITPRVLGSALPSSDLRIAVNKANNEKNMQNDLHQVAEIYRLLGDSGLRVFSTRHFTYGDEVPLTRLLTEDDIQRIDDLVDHTTRLYWPDNNLTNIIWETLGAYFAGDRALDDTIRLLNNRVGLYLNEQK